MEYDDYCPHACICGGQLDINMSCSHVPVTTRFDANVIRPRSRREMEGAD